MVIRAKLSCFRLKAFCFLSLFFFLGCASYTQQTQEIRENFSASNYDDALGLLEKSEVTSAERNRLLYHLEKSVILDRLNKPKESRPLLIKASSLVDELYTVSVSKEASSYFINDSMTDYAGEDYEKIAIHTMLALSFIEEGNFKSARIEARKISTRLNEITQKYDDKYNRFKVNPFAKYLSGMIFEKLGEVDSAIIDYHEALKVYESPSYNSTFGVNTPDQLIRALYVLAKKRRRSRIVKKLESNYGEVINSIKSQAGLGELIVFHEVGLISRKVSHDFIFNGGSRIIRVSWPTIFPKKYYNTSITGIEVSGKYTPSELFENMDYNASVCLEDRRGRVFLKNAARFIAKAKLADEAYERGGPIAGIAADIFSAVSETADTRSWTLLPSRFQVSRIKLPEGEYKVAIKNEGRISRVVPIKIRPNAMVVLRDK